MKTKIINEIVFTKILSRVWVDTGFGLVIGIIERLQIVTTKNCNSVTILNTLRFTIALAKHSLFVFSSGCLVTAPNTVDSSASVFTSLMATDCPIAPHGRNFWPLTPSWVWPPLATTRYPQASTHFRLRINWKLQLLLLIKFRRGPYRKHCLQQFLFCWVCILCCCHVILLRGTCLQGHCLAKAVSSGFERTCHNINSRLNSSNSCYRSIQVTWVTISFLVNVRLSLWLTD
jgi:hypothetical protein